MLDEILAYFSGKIPTEDEDEINRQIWEVCMETQKKLCDLNNTRPHLLSGSFPKNMQ